MDQTTNYQSTKSWTFMNEGIFAEGLEMSTVTENLLEGIEDAKDFRAIMVSMCTSIMVQSSTDTGSLFNQVVDYFKKSFDILDELSVHAIDVCMEADLEELYTHENPLLLGFSEGTPFSDIYMFAIGMSCIIKNTLNAGNQVNILDNGVLKGIYAGIFVVKHFYSVHYAEKFSNNHSCTMAEDLNSVQKIQEFEGKMNEIVKCGLWFYIYTQMVHARQIISCVSINGPEFFRMNRGFQGIRDSEHEDEE